TKVEDTRELLDNVPYAPTQGRFKVYLIDEVHMLSTHSFNALLGAGIVAAIPSFWNLPPKVLVGAGAGVAGGTALINTLGQM
ncbi:hypothetical protein, partial [Acinetobacter oleivorans]|uniref:hypothetical protein n=1 Tax=Acinetobacter oleivorans TaxID=1148157 RepID=UPI001C068475